MIKHVDVVQSDQTVSNMFDHLRSIDACTFCLLNTDHVMDHVMILERLDPLFKSCSLKSECLHMNYKLKMLAKRGN